MSTTQSDGKPAKRPRGRRWNYFIKPAFQGKYLALVVVSVFLASACMSFVLFGVLHQQARSRLLHLAESSTWENTYAILMFAGAYTAIMAAAFGVWSVILTHRMGGPMHVIEGYLAELTAGRFPRMRALRKRDEFREFYESFQNAIGAIKRGKQAELTRLTEALKTAKSAMESDSDRPKESLQSIARQLDDLCRTLRLELGTGFEPAVPSATTPHEARAKTPVTAK